MIIMKTKVMFTHIDLDGLVSAILFKKCYPNSLVYFTDYKKGLDYNEINEAILSVVPELPEEANILIADISPRVDVAEYLNQRGNVGLLDHHKTALPLSKYSWASIVQSKCGAMLVYEVLSQRFNIHDYYPLVELTDIYDRWQKDNDKFEHASKVSRLINIRGRDAFLDRFMLDASIELSPVELELLNADEYQMSRYIARSFQLAEVFKDKFGNQLVRVVADRYISQLGNTLMEYAPDYISYCLIFDPREMTVHLRSNGRTDVSMIAKEMGGGGHKDAAGFPLGINNLDSFNSMLSPLEDEEVEKGEREGQDTRIPEENKEGNNTSTTKK